MGAGAPDLPPVCCCVGGEGSPTSQGDMLVTGAGTGLVVVLLEAVLDTDECRPLEEGVVVLVSVGERPVNELSTGGVD